MDKIFFENFRCFRKMQTIPLSPLTLLVGENSTGKTSFLALVNALARLASSRTSPDFKQAPYDLGSFDEIAHHRGARGSKAASFLAGFESTTFTVTGTRGVRVEFEFTKEGTAAFPSSRRIAFGEQWGLERFKPDSQASVTIGSSKGTWERRLPSRGLPNRLASDRVFTDLETTLLIMPHRMPQLLPLNNSPQLEDLDKSALAEFGDGIRMFGDADFPVSIAPVRSSPHRTYDPARVVFDPEGDYVPMLLAEISADDMTKWAELKEGLERFGRDAGLFDDIQVKRLGKSGSDPFQLQVRKYSGKHKGPWRNLVDVGYGVSQALPIVTPILEDTDDGPGQVVFLLQQPEVHLHPSAQAALGSFFCQVAGSKRQLVVETHSDHLIDRIRMDIRDGRSALKPEDVTTLYFERNGLEVDIHPIRFDELGNVLDAPPSYRRFFMEEVTRSIIGPETEGES